MRSNSLGLKLLVVGLLLLASGPNALAQRDAPRAIPRDKTAAIERVLLDAVESGRVAGGVIRVTRDGRPVVDFAAGWADLEARRPMSRDALFRIASMTKAITSTAVMILVDDGKIALDDPVSKFIPEFDSPRVVRVVDGKLERRDASRPPTIRELLTHTSGLAYGFAVQAALGDPEERLYAAGHTDGLDASPLSLAENARRIGSYPLLFEPGTKFQYGLSTDVLGRVVEVASGRPFDAFLKERLFDPLGMHDTGFHVPPERAARLATVHARRGDELVPTPPGPQREGEIAYDVGAIADSALVYRSGGAGLVSTAADYARFCQMFLDDGRAGDRVVLRPETVRAMTTNQIGDLDVPFPLHGRGFGLGFGVVLEREAADQPVPPGTFGWAGLYYTHFFIDPKHRVSGVMMTQTFPSGGKDIRLDFMRAVTEAVSKP